MISAAELKANNADLDKKIEDDIEEILNRIQKKIDDPFTKRLYIPEKNIPFNYEDLFSKLNFTKDAYFKKLKKKLNDLGYDFYESTNMCPNGSYHTLYHLTWK